MIKNINVGAFLEVNYYGNEYITAAEVAAAEARLRVIAALVQQ